MVDLKNLSCAITDSGLTLKAIAEKMKMSRFTLYKRLNGDVEFKISEVALLSEILNLSTEQRDRIFFNL